jgi:hypothetical protein
MTAWTRLLLGGLIGAAVGVAGAVASDPGGDAFPWVELTGVVVGLGLGACAAGFVLLLRRRRVRPRHLEAPQEET